MKNRQGSVLLLLTLILPVVLAVSAYCINVAYMELARTELQATVDLATRAAGRTLAVSGDRAQAVLAANRLMQANPFANTQLTLTEADLVFGASTRNSETERYTFAENAQANAVEIRVNSKIRVPMLFPTLGVPVDFRPSKTAISTQTELDLVLVLDRSGSMAFGSNELSGNFLPIAAPPGWQFGYPVPPLSRWLDAVASVDSFLSYLQTTSQIERVGLVSYSDTASIDSKLQPTYDTVKQEIFKVTSAFNGGSTNIGDGIAFGAQVLSDKSVARPWASRVMIVLTDGIWTSGGDPMIAAQAAVNQQIVIYTVTFSAEADQARMQQIAALGKGEHYHASNGAELTQAFQAIARRLPTLLTD